MIGHYLKIALRNLWKHRGYSVINIAGLAIGMAFAILILLWVRFEVQFDRFHQNVDRLNLVAFTAVDGSFHSDQTVGATARHLREEYPEITRATRVSSYSHRTLRYDGQKYGASGRYVDPDFLEMFTFPLVSGNRERALVEPSSIAVTERLAERIFGDEEPLGKTLRFSGRLDLTVTAVMENPPANTQFRFDFLVPAEIGPEVYRRWDVKCLQTFAMLAEGADHGEVSRKIRDVYNDRNRTDTPNDYYLVPLERVHLHGLAGGGPIVYVAIFTGIAIAILLMACINFVNLATARAEIRYREIGVKKTIGARRGELTAQFVGESILLSLFALVLAVALVEWWVPMVNAVLHLRLRLDFSARTVLGLVGIAVATGIVAGSYPAFYLASLRPLAVLRRQEAIGGVSGTGVRGTTLRRLLVAVQFTLSAIFIVCVAVIFRQIVHVKNMDMGFDRNNVVLFYLPGELNSRTTVVKNELLNLPDIESVTASAGRLMQWQTSFGMDWEGKPDGLAFDVGFNQVDYDYLQTFRMEMTRGRFFSPEFPGDATGAYVVNEALVRAMGVEDPLEIEFVAAEGSPLEQRGKIIGVIRDYHTESAHKEIRPFMLGLTDRGNIMIVRMTPGSTRPTLRAIRSTLKQLQPDADPAFWFFDDEVLRLYAQEIVTGVVIVFIAWIAVLISCLGLFGLAAFMIRQRTKEIGIRKVLGASVTNIVALFVRETVAIVLVASLVGGLVGYLVMRSWLENYAYRTALGAWPFVLVTLLTLSIAILTVGAQATRAARANPIDAIRHE